MSVNCIDKISQCYVYNIGDSDHEGIMVHKRSREIKDNKRCIKRRSYKNFEEHSFKASISKAKENGSFCDVFETDDIDEAVKIFT